MSEKKGKPHALRLRKLAEASASEADEEYNAETNGAENTTTVPPDERRDGSRPRTPRQNDGSD